MQFKVFAVGGNPAFMLKTAPEGIYQDGGSCPGTIYIVSGLSDRIRQIVVIDEGTINIWKSREEFIDRKVYPINNVTISYE